MTNWPRLLRDTDPAQAGMSPDRSARMREVVLRSARTAAPQASVWRMRFALAAFACLVLTMSILGTGRPIPAPPEAVAPMAGSERRQVQFATPGGTRIIWELNPDFTLTETLP